MMNMNLHGVVRARVKMEHSAGHTWQRLILETSKYGSTSSHNPNTEEQEIVLHLFSHSFHPILPNTEDVDEAVEQLRGLSKMFHESGEVDGEEHINNLISRLGYPIVEPGDIEL